MISRRAGVALAVALMLASPAGAQSTDLDQKTRQVAASLRCPVCQGLSIQDSPAELAVEMKGLVREQLAAGKTPQQVQTYFIEKYGEWVLLEPPATGFNLLVYLLPLAALLGGGLAVWRLVRAAPNTPVEPPSP